ncbi:sugar phosphate nucleotidyltransferase [Arthrobacter agilis]|uniref:glucose-1-phosphate adenylyltransferase family protein n=1 Tax=Arthrobacter agilis TaxID=37921 RepID=UPI002365B68B|nr:sugar phosphate nucleotidyltransferase [Arthrobacter agilis]WDF33017.1 sugar phosphate nucleotidyltransferase [Arthrobacter agilis]
MDQPERAGYHPRILALVLAGGAGGRLGALTDHRAKPAMPVGGSFRLIDIPLTNLHHSGISDVWILEQYQPKTINDHLRNGRPWDLDRTRGGLLVLPPFSGREGEGFAEGNADGLVRQSAFIRDFAPDLVLVLSSDHLYRLDYRDLVETHRRAGALLTMVTVDFDGDASEHSVVTSDGDGRVTGFAYKPEEPASGVVAAEVFLYSTEALLEALRRLDDEHDGLGDYGDHLVPYFVERHDAVEHRLQGYWRDLGTPGSYLRAHLDLVEGRGLDLADPEWPILTAPPSVAPAVIGAGAEVDASLIAPGAVIRGTVRRSVIGAGALIEAGAVVEDSVVLDRARLEGGSRVRYGIVDSDAVIAGTCVGEGPERPVVVTRDGEIDD